VIVRGPSLEASDGSGEKFIDLHGMGARISQRDIFIHVDWMADATTTQRLDLEAIRRVYIAFALKGFSLHVDMGDDSTVFETNGRWGRLSASRVLPMQPTLGALTADASGKVAYDWAEFDAIKNAPGGFKSTGRERIFRYVVLARNLGNGAGGRVTNAGNARANGSEGGSDFIISLGPYGGTGSLDEQTGTFMHELGHSLGVQHGPRELTPEEAAFNLPIDTAAPVTTATTQPAPNAAGWNNADVTVRLAATDDNSGVARLEYNLDNSGWTQYTASVVISTDLIHVLQYHAIDRASNIEPAVSLTVKLDKTPSTITFSGNSGTYSILGTVSITCSTSDNLSGVASSTCQSISGPAYNFTPDTNSFSATATDNAGNTVTGTTTFTLRVTYADLCELSKQFVSNVGVALSYDICAQLSSA
jgi:hypothetical protein